MLILRLHSPDLKFKIDFVERYNLLCDKDRGTEKE